jgi:hypothetical protein
MNMTKIHFLRVVASFALLGAVIAGIVAGGGGRAPVSIGHGDEFDPRIIGALLGLIVGIVIAIDANDRRINTH